MKDIKALLIGMGGMIVAFLFICGPIYLAVKVSAWFLLIHFIPVFMGISYAVGYSILADMED